MSVFIVGVLIIFIISLVDTNNSNTIELTRLRENLKTANSIELTQLKENLKTAKENLKQLNEMHNTCSKELNSCRSDKETLTLNRALEQQKCQNDLQFKEEKLKDCNFEVSDHANLTAYLLSVIKNMSEECSDSKNEMSKLEGRIEEKEKYALAKIEDFNKLLQAKQDREDSFVDQLFDTKEKLTKCKVEKDAIYEQYAACSNSNSNSNGKWFN